MQTRGILRANQHAFGPKRSRKHRKTSGGLRLSCQALTPTRCRLVVADETPRHNAEGREGRGLKLCVRTSFRLSFRPLRCHPERSEGSPQFARTCGIRELQRSFLRFTQDRLRLLRMTARTVFQHPARRIPPVNDVCDTLRSYRTRSPSGGGAILLWILRSSESAMWV